MSSPVKRSYDSSRRQAQARANRLRVIEAAHALFVEHGYPAVSMPAIAEEAGVSVQTVYGAFGTKAALLKVVYDVVLIGDDEPVPVTDRPWVAQLMSEPLPARKVAIAVREATGISERLLDLDAVLAQAAPTDPEVAAQYENGRRSGRLGQRYLAEHLAELGALRPGLSVSDAGDVIWSMIGPGAYAVLRREARWSRKRTVAWITDALCRLLLDDGPGAS